MATNPTYEFETLLKLRKQKEDEAQRVVAARLGQIRQLEDRQQALQSRIEEHSARTVQILGAGALDVDGMRLSRHWMIRLRQGLLQAEAETRAQRAILAAERSQLAEASKHRKVLARLKERRLEQYFAEAERREQQEADEANVLRFAHAALAREHEST